MPPPQALEYNNETLFSNAKSLISFKYLTNIFLLDVTTFLPLLKALAQYLKGTSSPPKHSTTVSISGSSTISSILLVCKIGSLIFLSSILLTLMLFLEAIL